MTNTSNPIPSFSEFPEMSPEHIAYLIEELDLATRPAELSVEAIRTWVRATTDAIEFAYRNIGLKIAVFGLQASGVIDRYSVEDAARIVGFIEDLAWMMGQLGWSLDPAQMVTDRVIATLAINVEPIAEDRVLFADIVAILRSAREMYTLEPSAGRRS